MGRRSASLFVDGQCYASAASPSPGPVDPTKWAIPWTLEPSATMHLWVGKVVGYAATWRRSVQAGCGVLVPGQ